MKPEHGKIFPLLEAARPKQWIKNLFVFAAPLFSKHIFSEPRSVYYTIAAFILFCLASSSVYLVNDIIDLESDRKHPKKSLRPIASGRVSPRTALAAAIAFFVAAVSASLVMTLAGSSHWAFPVVIVVYTLLTHAYSFGLKHVVILDVFVLAAGFVLRTLGGGYAVGVEISPWLLLCTFLISLFLALSKRRHELVLLEDNATDHRAILREYSPYLLDQMIGVVTASTLMAYALYTMDVKVQAKLGTGRELVFTTLFVVYGIFRYLYLVHRKKEGGDPAELLLSDKSILINILLWVVAIVFLLAR
jgi:4-hydroxybenzoate polyprenyltransferase